MNLEDVEFSFSNKGLLPWEGGCLWEREGEKPLLQLRKVFKKQERFLWLYTRTEIIAHELVHARRLHFNEPIFEEVLAYRTSSSAFRRFFGPLFRSSKESLFFVLTLPTLFFLPMIYIGVLGFFLIRLFRVQCLFARAKRRLMKDLGDEERVFQHLILLTDKEIITIAHDA